MKHKKPTVKTSRKELAAERRLLREHSGAKEERLYRRILRKIRFEKPDYWWQDRSIWQKIGLVLLSLIILLTSSMYGIARWYIASQAHKEFKFGATFIPSYAAYFDLDPQETMQAMIDDLGIHHFRLVSYWDDIEKTPGIYDFSQLDWQFKKAEESGSTVSLAIGLRQPRWPECHMPGWAMTQPKDVWYPQLKAFMAKVIDHYKGSPALQSYQLENEFFLDVFGECPDFSRDRLIDEFNFVKQQDPYHTVIISRSNNAIGLPIGNPRPDKFGISVYKRVWDKTFTKRYFEYPFPAWFYAFLAGAGKIVTGKDMIIHELQTEPWGPNKGIKDISIEEQNKSLNAERLTNRIAYGRATGMREVDLWGVEMWYWRKVKMNDPSLWNAGKAAIRDQQCYDCYLPNK
jgi:hypothetical protein